MRPRQSWRPFHHLTERHRCIDEVKMMLEPLKDRGFFARLWYAYEDAQTLMDCHCKLDTIAQANVGCTTASI